MSWHLCIPIVVGILFIARPLLRAARGVTESLGTTGQRHLSAELMKCGIRPYIPDACLSEIAGYAADRFTDNARRKGEDPSWAKSEMLAQLERDARVIMEWTRGHDVAGETAEYIPLFLRKFGVPLGAKRREPGGTSA